MKLETRLNRAIKKLEETLAQNDEMYRSRHTERMRGKIEGIKLALSYLNEEKMKRVRELTRILTKHERPRSTNHGCEDCALIRSKL
jgi:hypothetical protein